MTGTSSRRKGQSGELEAAALLRELTGHDVRRKVRQHPLDVDLEGLDGWAIEVKRTARTYPHTLRSWWKQASENARAHGGLPVVFYRVDRQGWRVLWPSAAHLPDMNHSLEDFGATLQGTPITWWTLCQRLGVRRPTGVAVALSGV